MFIGGSGSHDRHGMAGDLDLGTHEIGDYLAEHGWLGARFDKHGTGTTPLSEDFLNAGFAQSLDDATAVLRATVARPEADSGFIAAIGHSEGALAAVELALDPAQVDCLVLLAMAGRPLPDVLADQIRNQARWVGQSDEQAETQVREMRDFVRFAQDDEEWDPDKIPGRFFVSKGHRRWFADHLARDPAYRSA